MIKLQMACKYFTKTKGYFKGPAGQLPYGMIFSVYNIKTAHILKGYCLVFVV